MADDDYDVMVNVRKGQEGYGIYFCQREGTISVTKIDKNSEAERAGVQPKDILVSVQDLDKKLPAEDPGGLVKVSAANYQAALQMVRSMEYCSLRFKAPGFG